MIASILKAGLPAVFGAFVALPASLAVAQDRANTITVAVQRDARSLDPGVNRDGRPME